LAKVDPSVSVMADVHVRHNVKPIPDGRILW
jgi:hypothetical protein